MSARESRGLGLAVGLTIAGLVCLAPVLIATGPITLGLFMLGALLVLSGVSLSAVGLLRSRRGRDPD